MISQNNPRSYSFPNAGSIAGIVPSANGGTGVANSTTLTLTGASALTLTLTGSTNVTLPTSGTLINSAVTSLASLATVGTIIAGTWNSVIGTSATGTTAAPFDNSTKIATTAYVNDTTGYRFTEDFTTGGGNASITTAVALNFEHAWAAVQIVGGTQSVLGIAGTFQHPGKVRITTAATSGQGCALYVGGGANTAAPLGVLGAASGWQSDFYFTLPATITNYCFRIGLARAGQQANDAPTDGFWFEYDTANTGNSDSFITFRTVNASTPTYTTTGNVTPIVSTNYHLRIFSTVAGTISYQIGSADGALGSVVNVTGNVNTTNAMMPLLQVIPRTTAALTFDFDKFEHQAKPGRV